MKNYDELSDKQLMTYLGSLLNESLNRDLIKDRPHMSDKGREILIGILREHDMLKGDDNHEIT